MYLEISELKTHAYDEEIKAIIENDETIALASINAAIAFAQSKLAKAHDIEQVFAQRGSDRNPLLLKIIKDIAIWELIGLANPSVDYEDKKFRYQQAADWLTAVYKGMPSGLPEKQGTTTEVKSFSYHANPPRRHKY